RTQRPVSLPSPWSSTAPPRSRSDRWASGSVRSGQSRADTAVESGVAHGHALRAETLPCTTCAPCAVEPIDLAYGALHLIHAALRHQHSRNPRVYDLGERPAREADDRRPAEHRLDGDEPERLFPLQRADQRARTLEQRQLAFVIRFAHELE